MKKFLLLLLFVSLTFFACSNNKQAEFDQYLQETNTQIDSCQNLNDLKSILKNFEIQITGLYGNEIPKENQVEILKLTSKVEVKMKSIIFSSFNILENQND